MTRSIERRVRTVILLGAAGALGLAAESRAGHTQTEIYQYFGNAQINTEPTPDVPFGGEGDIMQNPVVFHNIPGDIVYIPIWLRPQKGDQAEFTNIRAYYFEVYAREGGIHEGTDFAFASGDLRSFGEGTYYQLDEPVAGSGATHDLCVDRVQIVDRMGAASLWDTLMRSDGQGLPYDDTGNASYFLGYVGIQLGPNAIGETLELYFSTPDDGGLRYAANTTTGSLVTVAYGADDVGGADSVRCDNSNGDVIGTLPDRSSVVPDLTLLTNPEPSTIAMLALGIMMLRRRGRCHGN